VLEHAYIDLEEISSVRLWLKSTICSSASTCASLCSPTSKDYSEAQCAKLEADWIKSGRADGRVYGCITPAEALCYGNKYDDLRESMCGGKACATAEQAKQLESHYFRLGKTEGKTFGCTGGGMDALGSILNCSMPDTWSSAQSSLASNGGWVAAAAQAGEWVRVDLGRKVDVRGVAVMGRADDPSVGTLETTRIGSVWCASLNACVSHAVISPRATECMRVA